MTLRGFLSIFRYPWSSKLTDDGIPITSVSFKELDKFFYWIDNQTAWELYDGKWRMSDGVRMHTKTSMELYKHYKSLNHTG